MSICFNLCDIQFFPLLWRGILNCYLGRYNAPRLVVAMCLLLNQLAETEAFYQENSSLCGVLVPALLILACKSRGNGPAPGCAMKLNTITEPLSQ
jgi:hypothetical protein